MKIQLLSDLHLSVHPMPVPRTDADVVVVAGDLARAQGSIEWARQFEQPTLVVAGNHEFYGSDLETTIAQLREHAKGSRIHVLECEEWHFEGVRFLGCTLWSDHRLFADAQQREAGLRQAMSMVRDFSRIAVAPGRAELFTPDVSRAEFEKSVAWLDAKFGEAHDGPTVVVTHFAPARGSIHPRFAGSPLNPCFVSDLEDRILRWKPRLWLHGHMHDSFDYTVGSTRVVANPRGYAKSGVVENASFDPSLVIEVAP
ncbi:MAG: metallophosphoesterase family protein [Deltaproteobacteria bacterium]|nr:metallophosphoesterase family protein [Deltaproteobacteria bacterium]